MASPVNLGILAHPLNWVVVGAIALFWLLVYDVIARHYASVSNPSTAS